MSGTKNRGEGYEGIWSKARGHTGRDENEAERESPMTLEILGKALALNAAPKSSARASPN